MVSACSTAAFTRGSTLLSMLSVNVLGRRLISSQPQPHRGELDHGEEIGGELVIASGNAAEVLQFGEEPLDQVAFAVQPLAEAGFPLAVALRRDVGRGTLVLDQFADAVGVVGLVGQHDGARPKVVKQLVCDLPVVRLPGGQAEPDREPLRIDDDVDLGREPAA